VAVTQASRERWKTLLAEYGVLALIIHYTIMILFMVGFVSAVRLGWQPEDGADKGSGLWWELAAAYGAAKVLMPVRLAVTAVLVTIVGRFLPRLRKKKPPDGAAT